MRDLDNATYEYIRKVFLPSEDLQPVLSAMQEVNKAGMAIQAAEAKILQFMISSFDVKSVVEFGCFMAYSAIQMARALPQGSKLITIENNKEYYDKASEHVRRFGVADKVEILFGEAKDLLPSLDQTYDMTFIDADKAAYPIYLDWAEAHIKKGGLIIGDNTLLFGHVVHEQKPKDVSQARWQAMRDFNSRLSDTTKYRAMMLPTVEGMTIAQKLF